MEVDFAQINEKIKRSLQAQEEENKVSEKANKWFNNNNNVSMEEGGTIVETMINIVQNVDNEYFNMRENEEGSGGAVKKRERGKDELIST